MLIPFSNIFFALPKISLLSRAGQLMRQLLRHASSTAIEADERLQTYNLILRTLIDQQRWLRIFQPTIRRSWSVNLLPEEAESLVPFNVRTLPEELWVVILSMLVRNHLYGNRFLS